MARQEVNIGVEGNDGTGDSIRESFRKVNENFQEIYAVFGQGGSISFTLLDDTPNELEAQKIVTTNANGTGIIFSEIASDSDLDGSSEDSILVDTASVPGKIILSTSFSAIVDDNVNPSLGAHLDASSFGIAGVGISESVATAINSQPGRTSTYTIDDLVITKGYADRRYITSGLPIRVADEPETTSQYQLTIQSYVNGNLFIPGHGYDSGANGTAFIFDAEDTNPSGITSGTTYYIRYITDDQLALYINQEQAQTEDSTEAANNKISVSGTIASDDLHTITDAGYDPNLEGNFLSDVGMPRKSIVRRQGDRMEGELYLSDHPGELAGEGAPNGLEDLQAATKYYVDNTAYSSPEVLHVSTIGDDTMRGVPPGKEGTAPIYAFKSVNAAAKKAEELIKTAREEPGPYFQTLTHSAGATDCTTQTSGVENPVNSITAATLTNNRSYIINEVSGFIKFTYPDFSYNVATCQRDLGLIIDSLGLDAERGNNANYLSRTAAERYYSSVSGKIAITSQLTQTSASFAFLRDLITSSILQNGLYQGKQISSLTKLTGNSPAVVTTTTLHGFVNKQLIIFKDVTGMTEINGEFAYAKVIDDTTFELFDDPDFDVPFDNSNYTPFVSGRVGIRYQTKFAQDTSLAQVWDGASAGAEPTGASSITTNANLIINIIENGIDAGADINFGNRYSLEVDNNTSGFTDQTNPDNVDAIPGKVIKGKRSGALGRIIVFEQDTNSTTFFLQLLEPKRFEVGEELEYGNFVKAKQIVIRVESGIYEEDYPIKLVNNVSLKGDEFRRVIIRPKRRVSQSKYANTYFYRDAQFDDLELYTTGTPFINQVGETQGYFGYHYLKDNTKPVNVGDTVDNLGYYNVAADIMTRNKEFIQDEVIAYINTNFVATGFSYDEAKCRRDSGILLEGVGFDIAFGTNYNAVTNGLAYQRANSSYVQSNQKAQTIGAINFLKNGALDLAQAQGSSSTADARLENYFAEVIDIIDNGTVSTNNSADALVFPAPAALPTTDADDAAIRLQNNRAFLAADVVAFVNNNNPPAGYDTVKCNRDVGYIVDALTYDLLYGGNSASRVAAESYFEGATSQLGAGQTAPTIAAYGHLSSVAQDIIQGNAVVPQSGNALSVNGAGNDAGATEATQLNTLVTIITDVLTAGSTTGMPAEVFPSVLSQTQALQDAKTGIDNGSSGLIDDTIDFINNTYVSFSYNETKCRRDTGYIIDRLISDLIRGGQEGVQEAQGQYEESYINDQNNGGFVGQEAITSSAINYISTLAAQLLVGTAPTVSPTTVFQPDVTLGSSFQTWQAGVRYAQNDIVYFAPRYFRAKLEHISEQSDSGIDPITQSNSLTNTTRWVQVLGPVDVVGDLIDVVTFAFDNDYNPPLRNDQMDVFLMDDATIIRNVTVQGHGGFMCVLDPEGQILTKSPYIQTATSFSLSANKKAFRGGMFVDAFAGNIPMRVIANSGNFVDDNESVPLNTFTLEVESQDVNGVAQGLKLRLPQLPAPFYFEGQRFQVNAISNYDSGLGRAVIYLDPNSNNGLGWNKVGTDPVGDPSHDPADVQQDIFLQTAGNRSILGNDFTQINDLGYGLVTNNGAFSEMVSMFTYYTHAAYYANNGSEIRSLNGSNGYGNFGLVAEGADPNEIPDQVTIGRRMAQPIKAFTYGGFTNALQDTSLTVFDFKDVPMNNAFITIDHGGATGTLNYKVTRAQNLSDPNNDGNIGAEGAVVATGVEELDAAFGGGNGFTGVVPNVSGSFAAVPQKSTTGSGYDFTIDITINSGTVTSYTINNSGQVYSAGDTITISGASISGSDGANDLTFSVSATYGTTSGTSIFPQVTGNINDVFIDPANGEIIITTSSNHNLSNSDRVLLEDIQGPSSLNGQRVFVDVLTPTTFKCFLDETLLIPVDGTGYGSYVVGGTFKKPGGIGNHIYRLTIQEQGSNTDFFADLQAAVANGDEVEYRHGENFIFAGVANQGITERPSTAVNFDESDGVTYRSTGFTITDDQSIALPRDQIKATFDTEFKYVPIEIDFSNIGTAAPGGGGTMGASTTDTYLAVNKITDATDAARVVQDATDAVFQNILEPGDPGYTGGMIFAYGGRTLRIKDYGPTIFGAITSISQASPGRVTTTAPHGLSSGARVEFEFLGGMTTLNGQTYYIDVIDTTNFDIYTDAGLSNPVSTASFNAHTPGSGRWVSALSPWYIEVEYVTGTDLNGNAADGIALVPTADRFIYAGLIEGTTAEITVAISLLRATGHDFTEIGTGGFNTSNYPNVLLGEPIGGSAAKAGPYSDSPNATKAQVWERRKGRVFFITSDNDGFFRVGKYFVVDQSTGSITFAGDVGISRAASLGFKEGVTIDEFSNDELFTDLSDTAVPTEKAIANYVSRRLGHDGTAQLTGTSRFAPGFMALNGSTPMEANMNLNLKQIKNLADPTDDNDATTKDFVDQAVSAYDEITDLRNVTVSSVPSASLSKQLFVPTGKRRIVIEPPATGSFTVGGTITNGTAQGDIVALLSKFDKVRNANVLIVTYTLTTASDFNITIPALNNGVVGTPGATTSTLLEDPIDEFANAVESTASDINITISRTSTGAEVDLQLEADSILDADVNVDAKISQSKLMMKRATTKENSAGMFGDDDDSTTGRVGQSSRGLAAFEETSFAEDVLLRVADPGTLTLFAGDIITQGTGGNVPLGYVTADVTNSQTVTIRTVDTFIEDNTQLYVQEFDGVTGTHGVSTALVDSSPTPQPITLNSSLLGNVTRSGYISLRDRGIGFDKLPDLPTDSVIGRRRANAGLSESVTFAQVIDEGFGLADGDFTSILAYGTPVNDPGQALIKIGNGDYRITEIAYDNESTSIAKRDLNGSLHATSFILGGDPSYEILSESSATLTMKTPEQGVIFTSVGASKPTINTGGVISVGDVPAYSESTIHSNSTYGSAGGLVGGTTETSAVNTRWVYTSFIETPNEKDGNGTGIGIGSNTGFNLGGADTVHFVAGGAVEARVTTVGVETDDIRALNTNTNLNVGANGTGQVFITGTGGLKLPVGTSAQRPGTASGTTAAQGMVRFNSSDTTFEGYDGTNWGSLGGVKDVDQDTYISAEDTPGTDNDQLRFYTAGVERLTIGSTGGVTVASTDTLTVRTISTGAATTTGTVTGRWSLTANSRFEATYADLAEYYEGDAEYEVGTVLVFGGDKEVTTTSKKGDHRVAGVVSEQSAYIMNNGCPGIKTCVALQGRVPVKVIGTVTKGDMIVSSAIPGYGMVNNSPGIGQVIGKALANKTDDGKGMVEVVVGRV